MPNFLIFCGILPLLCGKPVILDIHDTMVETYAAKFDGKERKFLAWLLRMEEAICCRLARRIVCVNDIQKLALVRRKVPEEKIVVAMNLPDPKVFNHSRPIRVRPRIDSQFRLIYHGTVTKRIGVDRAIQAVAELNGKVPGLELHIVGDGDDLDEFRELGYSMNAGDTIHFHGRVPLDSLVGILEDMDLGIIPNGRNEATELMLPVKMLECMALGIPVVAPRLLAIKHYFSENMVFFFDPGNIPSMVDAISQACQSEESRLEKARAARGFLLENGWDTHKSGFIGLYRDLEN